MSQSSKNWCFTINRPDVMTEEEFLNVYSADNVINNHFKGKVDYAIFQLERGKKCGRLHYQGYLEYPEKTTGKKIYKILGISCMILKKRYGTQEQASSYCLKDETYVDGPWSLGEKHKQGKRNDLAELYDDLEDGKTVKEMLMLHRHKALQIIHCIEKGAKALNGLLYIDKLILKKRRLRELETIISHCEGVIASAVDNDYEPTDAEAMQVMDLQIYRNEHKRLKESIESTETITMQ